MHDDRREPPAYEQTLDIVTGSITDDAPRKTLTKTALGGGGVTALGALLAGLSAPMPIWALVLALGVIMLRVGSSTAAPRRRSSTRSARVRVTPAGIELDGVRSIPAEAIAAAYRQPRSARSQSVCCVDRKGEILLEAEVGSDRAAADFLEALGHDVTRRRLQYAVDSPMRATPLRRAASVLTGGAFGLLIGTLTINLDYGAATALLALLAFLLPLIFPFVPRSLAVGMDGLLLKWLWTRRFIRHDEISRVEEVGESLHLVLKDGRRVALGQVSSSARHRGQRRGGSRDDGLARSALQARIQEAHEAHQRSRNETATLATRIARGARPVAEWRVELSKLRDDGYRTTATRDEDLWRLVEDPTAPEDARAAAALALRSTDEAGPRLRIAAETVASPRLRVALERAADPEADERAIDEALASFEAEMKQKSA